MWRNCMGRRLHGQETAWAGDCLGRRLCGQETAWAGDCMGRRLHGWETAWAGDCLGRRLHGWETAWAGDCLGRRLPSSIALVSWETVIIIIILLSHTFVSIFDNTSFIPEYLTNSTILSQSSLAIL